MREMNIFEKIFSFVTNLFKPKKKKLEDNIILKNEMCNRAIQSDVCPKCCEICAWFVSLSEYEDFYSQGGKL